MPLRMELVADGPGLRESAEEMAGLSDRARNAKPAMRAALNVMLQAEREQFETKGAAGGKPWKDDSDKWREQKAKLGKATEPERFTDALMRSLTETKGPDAIRSATKQQARFGTKLYYARFQRNPLIRVGFQREPVNQMRDIVVEWLLNGTTPEG